MNDASRGECQGFQLINTSNGVWGYAAALVAGILITFVGRQLAKLGYVLGSEEYDVSLNNIFVKISGRFLIIFSSFSCTGYLSS